MEYVSIKQTKERLTLYQELISLINIPLNLNYLFSTQQSK